MEFSLPTPHATWKQKLWVEAGAVENIEGPKNTPLSPPLGTSSRSPLLT